MVWAGCKAAHRATARRRDGDIAPYRNGTRAGRAAMGAGQGRARWACAARATGGAARGAECKAAHRGGEPPRAMRCGGASREARRPSIAPYHNGTRVERGARAQGRGHGKDARDGRAAYGDGEPSRTRMRRGLDAGAIWYERGGRRFRNGQFEGTYRRGSRRRAGSRLLSRKRGLERGLRGCRRRK